MRPYYVVIILLMGLVTYATRVGLVGIARQFTLHPLLKRLLEYVPVSVLAALIFPAVLAPSGRLESPLTNTSVWAAIFTSVVLIATRRPWLAIILGVVAFASLRWVFAR